MREGGREGVVVGWYHSRGKYLLVSRVDWWTIGRD